MSQSWTDQDAQYMAMAIEAASKFRGRTSPNPAVGAVIVRDGRVLAVGAHRAAGSPHAEAEAFAAANEDVRGATLYVTLEPCSHTGRTPPCAPEIVRRGITRCVVAIADPNPQVAGRGLQILRDAGVRVELGLLREEAAALIEHFLFFHKAKRPFVTSKWAMTLDGRIAADSGHSRWITAAPARAFVHRLRSEHDAIMIGIGTLLADDPTLNVRLDDDPQAPQPIRVVCDGKLKIPLRAKCLDQSAGGKTIIATSAQAPAERIAQLQAEGHRVIVCRGRKGLVDMPELLQELAALGVQSLFCEGGGGIHGALIEARLVSKVMAFVAPRVVGGAAQSAKVPVHGWGMQTMSDALTLQRSSVMTIGSDVVISGYLFDAMETILDSEGTT